MVTMQSIQFNIRKLIALLFVLNVFSAYSFTTHATAGYAYSMGGLTTSVQQIINTANNWAYCGYTSYYNTDITYSYLSSSSVLNSDILYFSGSGSQNSVKLEDNLYLISGSSNGTNKVGLSGYTLSNTKLAIFNSSYSASTASGTSNICTKARNRGADAAIGWVYGLSVDDSTKWQSRFQSYCVSHHKVNIAMDYADSFTDYDSNANTKSHLIYGNWEQYISNSKDTSDESSDTVKDNRVVNIDTIKCQYDNIDYDAISQAIQSYNSDFDAAQYDVTTTSTSQDNSSFVVDYTLNINGYTTNSGYTFIFHDNEADVFYDNTIQTAGDTKNPADTATAQLQRNEAIQAANTEFAAITGNNRITQQDVVLYYDIVNNQSYYKILTEYQDIDDGCYGTIVTMYAIR